MAEFNGDFRDVVAQAFQKAGGVASLVKWIKGSAANRGQFYSQMVAKMVALPPVTQVNVAIGNSDSERRSLETAMVDALERVRAARQDGMPAGVIIDNVAQPQLGPVIEHDAAPPIREPAAAADRLAYAGNSPAAANVHRLAVAPDALNQQQVDRDRARERATKPLTPAEAKAKAAEPLPQPISNQPSTTEQFLRWSNGGRVDWSGDLRNRY
jgi:hypothetical protein